MKPCSATQKPAASRPHSRGFFGRSPPYARALSRSWPCLPSRPPPPPPHAADTEAPARAARASCRPTGRHRCTAAQPPAATAGGCSVVPTAAGTHHHRSGGQISCLPSNSRVSRFAEQAASSANGGCCLPSNRSAARGSRCLSASESESIGHRRTRLRSEQCFANRIANRRCGRGR